MQGDKTTTVVASAKEAAANVGASAWSGKEKVQAVLEEKVAKVRAHDPAEKAAADARMQERLREAEAAKRDAMCENAAVKERATAAVHQPTLPEPPARTVDGRRDTRALPGARLVNGAGDGVAGVGDATEAAPNATETGASGAPETAVVKDTAHTGTTDGYPTTATGGHQP